MKGEDIVIKDTKRPFRLYNANSKTYLPWRNFKHAQRAHVGAMIDVRWAHVGTVIEVIDVAHGRMVGQYKRGVNDIKFLKG